MVTMDGMERLARVIYFGDDFLQKIYEKGGLSNATTVGGFSHMGFWVEINVLVIVYLHND